jgi:hypothetical protein
MATAARGVVAVPDGATAGQPVEPGSAEVQIAGTVAVAKVYETVAPLLGGNAAFDTGGGGGGGSFMFASIEELDGVVGQWRDLIEDIKTDQHTMAAAGGDIAAPAADQVSGRNYAESSKVVMDMQKHNELLLKYAIEYTKKLETSRTQMVTTEHGNEARMNQVHR